ncbi:hypothetical protein ES708_31783 [subsurface metagenome]
MATLINEEKLGKAIDGGLDKLITVMKAAKPAKESLLQARLASSVLSTGAKYMGAQNSRLSLQLRVATMVLKDGKERREYLAAASPELKLLV